MTDIPAVSLTITQPLRETIQFIHDFTQAHHYPPLYREIVDHLGLSTKSLAKSRVDQLRDLGLVTYKERSPRTIRLTEAGKAYLVAGAETDMIAFDESTEFDARTFKAIKERLGSHVE